VRIAAFVPNIFDRSRFEGGPSTEVSFVDNAAALTDLDPDLVLVDLDRCPDPADFAPDPAGPDGHTGSHVIGFGSHVDVDGQQRARELGFHEVVPRSVFFRRLPSLLVDPPGRQPDRTGQQLEGNGPAEAAGTGENR